MDKMKLEAEGGTGLERSMSGVSSSLPASWDNFRTVRAEERIVASKSLRMGMERDEGQEGLREHRANEGEQNRRKAINNSCLHRHT